MRAAFRMYKLTCRFHIRDSVRSAPSCLNLFPLSHLVCAPVMNCLHKQTGRHKGTLATTFRDILYRHANDQMLNYFQTLCDTHTLLETTETTLPAQGLQNIEETTLSR